MHKNKEDILIHLEYSIDFVKKLLEVSEENWRTPISKDKWTVAEVVGHLAPWDEFLLNDRLPYLLDNTPLPIGPDVDELNRQSAEISRSKSKEEIISNFINVRRNLIITINNLDDELWDRNLNLGETSLTLDEYLKGFKDHDLHHINQINKVVNVASL
ncbi:DinB family protein [Ureibacillus acetophenoni]|uniref:DinB family protein n=1 Tax=Ureibacillus acetophenoni TaxID=614649 RepID=A0A285UNN3_9BACL|nr:DinB family protein [Ureibacillus acetophenoni]SOC41841.1 DinB family protein [Ureibacillus acetophenoni]